MKTKFKILFILIIKLTHGNEQSMKTKMPQLSCGILVLFFVCHIF